MTDSVHGYGTPEQERLVEQAEHWRHRLIRDGTELEPGTGLLEAESMMEVVIPSEARDLQWTRGFTRQEMRHILLIVKQEQDHLLRSWNEHFGR